MPTKTGKSAFTRLFSCHKLHDAPNSCGVLGLSVACGAPELHCNIGLSRLFRPPRASFWARLHAALSHRSPFQDAKRTRNARHHACDGNPPQPAGRCRGRRLYAYAAATTTVALLPLCSSCVSGSALLCACQSSGHSQTSPTHPPTHPLLTSPRLHACAEYPPGGNNRLVSRSPPAPPTTLPCPDPRPPPSCLGS